MKLKKPKLSTIIFVILIGLLIVPTTRQSIQVALHKGIAIINPVHIVSSEKRVEISDFNWQLVDEDQSIYNFREAKGKVVLINFWATWCPPCIAEMPSLQALYEDYSDSVEFLFVTNDSFEIVDKFKEKRGFTFPVYIPKTKVPQELVTKSIPRTLIINKNGNIVIDKSGAVDWNSKTVKSQLNQLISE